MSTAHSARHCAPLLYCGNLSCQARWRAARFFILVMEIIENKAKLELIYSILCEDVRLEVGNKLSLMGVFQTMTVQQLPFAMLKFAVVNHWRGDGRYLSEVRILTPDRQQILAASQPAPIEVAPGGFAGNISFFANLVFSAPGVYWVQTLVDANLYDEQPLPVMTVDGIPPAADDDEEFPEIVN